MRNQTIKRRFIRCSSFFQGFGSVVNIAGPNPNEYLKFLDTLPNASLEHSWKSVGDNIVLCVTLNCQKRFTQ